MPESTKPLTAKPSAVSDASALCPPTRAQPSARKISVAPCSIADNSARIFRDDAYGTEAIASAVQGSAPMAYRSDKRMRGGDLAEHKWIVQKCPKVIYRLDQ